MGLEQSPDSIDESIEITRSPVVKDFKDIKIDQSFFNRGDRSLNIISPKRKTTIGRNFKLPELSNSEW